MTQFILDEVTRVEFEEGIKNAYQSGMKLPMDCAHAGQVNGDSIYYNKAGTGTTSRRNNGQFDRTNPKHTKTSRVKNLMETFKATELYDPFEGEQISFNPNHFIVENMSTAIGRRMDQLKMNALGEAGQQNKTVATSVGGAATNLNVTKILAAKNYMDSENIPEDDRYMLVHANQINLGMLQDDKVINGDYSDIKALVTGQVDTYLGFKFIKIGNFEVDGDVVGLPLNGGVRECYAWHKRSLGYGSNFNYPLRVDPLPEADLNLQFYQAFTAGAQVIDPVGIVKVNCTEGTI